ncbi:hypothetical protein [Rhodanobacter sp. L36]|nr:hypothetical protein [Rhodanobacter sp. L36]
MSNDPQQEQAFLQQLRASGSSAIEGCGGAIQAMVDNTDRQHKVHAG